MPQEKKIQKLRSSLLRCRRCNRVIPPVVSGLPVVSEIYLLGQAPGPHEGRIGRPFAYTAGKNMFKWFEQLGVEEEIFRRRVYMAAVLRCFPGKNRTGGDRVPSKKEIKLCRTWIASEQELLKPRLIIPVGRLAIEQVMWHRLDKLDTVVGKLNQSVYFDRKVDWIALPHPSGLSTWYKTEPGKTLLKKALGKLKQHPSWKRTFM